MNFSPDQIATRHRLRQRCRSLRRSHSTLQQRRHALSLARSIQHTRAFRCARNIACYQASDGEISLQPLIDIAWRRGKAVFLPVIHHKRLMRFVRYTPSSKLYRGKWELLQPVGSAVNPRRFDLMILPLVAFDLEGNRLGRGGGFYDYFLARHFARSRANSTMPFLLGAAHACQQVAKIPAAAWDLRLMAVATERSILAFKR